ncbi:hypothetical protein HMPREF1868_00201 [Olsenella sp. DNF00959]|nr:hypothetical protein HMPREF1868_00201 [Olsenella sp. DNF00959]
MFELRLALRGEVTPHVASAELHSKLDFWQKRPPVAKLQEDELG